MKNRWSKAGKDGAGTGSLMTVLLRDSREIFEAPARDRHEIGNASEIPIGVGYFDVTDVGRKRRHRVVDIGATVLPKQDAPADEGVSQIVDANLGVCAAVDPALSRAKLLKDVMNHPR